MKTKKKNIYELKISLKGAKPSIYRVIQIKNDSTFFDLHAAIQLSFGWMNSHLHEFTINGMRIGMVGMDEFDENPELLDDKDIKLCDMISFEKQKFSYVYDFGDDWDHQIELVKILPVDSSVSYPKCIRGKRCCPPDDVGGIWGFEEFKEIMSDPKHPEYEERAEWYDGVFDPDEFSLKEINSELKDFEKAKLTIDWE